MAEHAQWLHGALHAPDHGQRTEPAGPVPPFPTDQPNPSGRPDNRTSSGPTATAVTPDSPLIGATYSSDTPPGPSTLAVTARNSISITAALRLSRHQGGPGTRTGPGRPVPQPEGEVRNGPTAIGNLRDDPR